MNTVLCKDQKLETQLKVANRHTDPEEYAPNNMMQRYDKLVCLWKHFAPVLRHVGLQGQGQSNNVKNLYGTCNFSLRETNFK